MVFCGIDVGQVLEQAKPGELFRLLDASTPTTWRKRMGAEGVHVVEAVISQPLVQEQVVLDTTMVTDTTAQEKSIVYPTETGLLDKGRRQLVKLIRRATAAGAARAGAVG
jgi:hypothetical protein